MQQITIHTDGASRGNPGKAAIAYTINIDGKEVIEHAETIGETTNNQAEYKALLAATKKLHEQDISNSQLDFFADSELMVKQINKEYRVKNAELQPVYDELCRQITALLERGNSLTFSAVRREHNKRADQLANLALDGKY